MIYDAIFKKKQSGNLSGNGQLNLDPGVYTSYKFTGINGTVNITNPSFNVDGIEVEILLKDAGVSKTLTWGNLFEGTMYALPNSTTMGKWMYFIFRYNDIATKWQLIKYNVQI